MPLFFGTRKHPKGPDLWTARWLQFDYSGNVFRLKVPPNTEHELSTVIGRPVENIYDLSCFAQDDVGPDLPMVHRGGHRENWAYQGLPLIDGCLGHMGMYIAVLRTTRYGNLFCPKHFESFVYADIDRRYGPESSKGGGERGRSRAPLNWQVPIINGQQWARFEVESPRKRKFYSVWTTAISASHVIECGFDTQEHNPHQYCRAAFKDTIQHIVETFQITLSEASLQEQREAEAQWPDAQFSETLPEKPWSKLFSDELAVSATVNE